MLESSASSLDRAREVERRFLWFIDDMLYRADTESLEQIYRSRFRFLYRVCRTVARSPEERRPDPVVIDPGAMQKAPAGLQPAGFFRRLPATIIDMIIYCGVCALLAYPVSRDIDWRIAIADPAVFMDSLTDPGWITHAAGILGLWIALWWCYFAVGWGLARRHNRQVGLRPEDRRPQGPLPIGLSRAFLRLAAYSVSSVTLGMGHLLIALRPDRRALHDVLAGTWVVRRPKTIQPAPPNDDETDADDDIDNS